VLDLVAPQIGAPPFADPLLEGDGFELLVPRTAAREPRIFVSWRRPASPQSGEIGAFPLSLPERERPNLLAKYRVTTEAVALSRR
jgi:hypothetical protein